MPSRSQSTHLLGVLRIARYGMGFAGTRLAIGQDAPIVALHHCLINRQGRPLEQVDLGRLFVENAFEAEREMFGDDLLNTRPLLCRLRY
jgi:hypothetical protein